jgi:hypothetical protein
VGPRAGLETVVNRKILSPCRDSKPPIIQPAEVNNVWIFTHAFMALFLGTVEHSIVVNTGIKVMNSYNAGTIPNVYPHLHGLVLRHSGRFPVVNISLKI